MMVTMAMMVMMETILLHHLVVTTVMVLHPTMVMMVVMTLRMVMVGMTKRVMVMVMALLHLVVQVAQRCHLQAQVATTAAIATPTMVRVRRGGATHLASLVELLPTSRPMLLVVLVVAARVGSRQQLAAMQHRALSSGLAAMLLVPVAQVAATQHKALRSSLL
jgi:hypothetical protein